MGINKIQFQKGLSMAEFMERYGTEEKCQAALVCSRWPSGFVCPECGGARIRKADVSIAKNYLNEEELRALNNLAEQYLIFAEGQAMRRIAMTMQEWVSKLEGFLTLNDREILQGAGKVSAELAKTHAEQEFGKFRILDDQHFESDFDQNGEAFTRQNARGGRLMNFRIAALSPTVVMAFQAVVSEVNSMRICSPKSHGNYLIVLVRNVMFWCVS